MKTQQKLKDHFLNKKLKFVPRFIVNTANFCCFLLLWIIEFNQKKEKKF